MSQCALNLRHILYANAVSSQWLQCDQKLNKNSKPNKAFKKIKKNLCLLYMFKSVFFD